MKIRGNGPRATGYTLFNTHLGFTPEHRQKAPGLLLEQIDQAAVDMPRIVLGDFNFLSGSVQYRELTKRREPPTRSLFDAMKIADEGHHGPTSTFTDFKQPGPPGSRIDYVFVNSGFRVLKHHILADTFDGRYPSDHMPVLAELDLP